MQPLRKTVWKFLKKLNIGLPYDPAIPLWVYTQKNQKQGLKEIFVHCVHSRVTQNSQKVEAVQVSTDRGWINKMLYYINTMEQYSAFKEGNSSFKNVLQHVLQHG